MPYANAHTPTSATCAIIRIPTVVTMAVASQTWGRWCSQVRARRAVPTAAAITAAWIAMLPRLTAPPMRSCRNKIHLLGSRDQVKDSRDDEIEGQQLGSLEPVGPARRGNGRPEQHRPEQHPHLGLREHQPEL